MNEAGESEEVFLTQVSASPNELAAGDLITTTVQQNYEGNRSTDLLPEIDVAYWLSDDCVIDNTDILLGGDAFNIGSDNMNEIKSSSLSIPSNTEAGTYFILFRADANEEIAESDEDNNIECIEINITNNQVDVFLTLSLIHI